MRGKALLSVAAAHVMDAIYPARCLACPSATETPMGLCGDCWRQVHFFAGPVCDLCGVPVPTADKTTERTVCNGCDQAPPGWDQGRSAVAYEGVGRQVVMAFKHADRLDMAMPLARWMTGAGAAILTPDQLVVPVPIHWSKLIRRRYNQAAVLAQHVAKRTGATFCPDLLQRTRATPELKGKTRTERQDLQRASMRVNPRKHRSLKGRDILLVDDVMTSGATLATATEVLRGEAVNQISVLTLARVARVE